MGHPTRKAARMSEWVLHCEVKQRHIRRSQPTRDAALKDACSQLLQGYSVNRIVGPNETITAERIKSWCASRGFPQEPLWRTSITSGRGSRVELWPCCNIQHFLCGSRAGARISAQAERTLTFANDSQNFKPRLPRGAFSLQAARHATGQPLCVIGLFSQRSAWQWHRSSAYPRSV